MLKRREELEQSLRREENRLHALKARCELQRASIESVQRSILWLQDEIKRISNDIDQFIQKDLELKEQVENLKTISGIGKKNSQFILVLMHRWNHITKGQGSNKALTAYVGLDPVPCSSGSSIRHHEAISRKGNPTLRKYLYLGALGGVCGNNPLSVFYKRLVANGNHVLEV